MAVHGGPIAESPTEFMDLGLSAVEIQERGREHEIPAPAAHSHMELEMLLVQTGHYTMEFAGRNERVNEGELGVFWAGFPHRGVARATGTIFRAAHLPVVQILSWHDPDPHIDRLLHGWFLHTKACPSDTFTFTRWSADLATGNPQLRAIVEQEMQLRLRRAFFDATGTTPAPLRHEESLTAAGVAAAIRYIVRHFMEHITVDDVADAVGWHRRHLMRSFHRICGVTMWDYVMRVRLAEAQRLLAVTDLPVLTICDRAGFTSTTRMYETFRRYGDLTPSEYRNALRG